MSLRDQHIEASVSVAIPVYNGASHIEEALGSVLAQGSVLRDVVVLDNASTDNTADLVRGFDDPRVRLEHQSSLVPAWRNWSDACGLSDAPFFKLVCADDRLLPNALSEQAAVLLDDPRVGAVSSRRRVITHGGRVLARAIGVATDGPQSWESVLTESLLSGGNQIGEPACVLFRTELLLAALPWSDTWAYLIDLDMYARVLSGLTYVGLDEIHADFRLSRGSWSSALRETQAREFADFASAMRDRGDVDLTTRQLEGIEREACRRARTRRVAYAVADLLDAVPAVTLPGRFRV